MTRALAVGIGGFLGALLRYLLSGWIQRWTDASFPYGTLAVNVLGCFVLGFLAALGESRAVLSAETRALLLIGVLGSFTTFSTFGYETLALLRDGEGFLAGGNVLLHVVLGLGAAYLGILLTRLW